MSSEWIGFTGTHKDTCPVDKYCTVEVGLRNDDKLDGMAGHFRWNVSDSDDFGDYQADIIKYRVIGFSSEKEPSTQPSKDTMKIYCDNFLALTKALHAAGGEASWILSHNHEFLEILARNRIEIDAKYIEERV